MDVGAHELRVEQPAAALVRLPARHLAAHRLGDLVQRLVGGERGDHMVARLEQAVHGQEDELFGGAGEHVVGSGALIQARDLGPQQRVAQ